MVEKDFLASAMKCYPGSVVVVDEKANVLYANDIAAKLMNMSIEKLQKKNYYDMVADGTLSDSVCVHVLQTGYNAVKLAHSSSNDIWTCAYPIKDEQGNVKYVCSISYALEEMVSVNKWLDIEMDRMKHAFQLAEFRRMRNPSVIAESEEMKKLLQTAQMLAPTTGIVLLGGESGSGKEVLAKYLHEHSLQKDGNFLAVNCAAIPEELAESEFFGYEAGAFTGAKKNGAAGYFEVTEGGTLFLDEIGELSLTIQSKLLRAIENREYTRVGGRQAVKVESRIICATNRDLQQMVKEGKFREDLYYRINVLPLFIPPLRERKADILPLAEKFREDFCQKNGVEHLFDDATKEMMLAYDWPGNIRELRNLVERAVIIAPDYRIIPEVMFMMMPMKNKMESEVEKDDVRPLKEIMQEKECAYLKRVLDQYKWDVKKVSEVLEMHPSGLYKKIKDYDLKE